MLQLVTMKTAAMPSTCLTLHYTNITLQIARWLLAAELRDLAMVIVLPSSSRYQIAD